MGDLLAPRLQKGKRCFHWAPPTLLNLSLFFFSPDGPFCYSAFCAFSISLSLNKEGFCLFTCSSEIMSVKVFSKNAGCYAWLFLPAPVLKDPTKAVDINHKTANTTEFQHISAHQGRWEVSWAKQKTDLMLKSPLGALEPWANIGHAEGVALEGVDLKVKCWRAGLSWVGLTEWDCQESFNCSRLSVPVCKVKELTGGNL